MSKPTTAQNKFLESARAKEIRDILESMEADADFITEGGMDTNAALESDDRITFTEKHILYLSRHQYVNFDHYISNLRFMTKIRVTRK